MKKTTQTAAALIFLLAFTGLSVYFFFAEDFCPVHNPPPAGNAFSHTHRALPSICLCFWGTLFAPGRFDFSFFQGIERLAERPLDRSPLRAFNADIAHPPEALSS